MSSVSKVFNLTAHDTWNKFSLVVIACQTCKQWILEKFLTVNLLEEHLKDLLHST